MKLQKEDQQDGKRVFKLSAGNKKEAKSNLFAPIKLQEMLSGRLTAKMSTQHRRNMGF